MGCSKSIGTGGRPRMSQMVLRAGTTMPAGVSTTVGMQPRFARSPRDQHSSMKPQCSASHLVMLVHAGGNHRSDVSCGLNHAGGAVLVG